MLQIYILQWNYLDIYRAITRCQSDVLISCCFSPGSETGDGKSTNSETFKLKDSLDTIQSKRSALPSYKKDILCNIGSFRRALCARKDLEIRRKLCNVETVSTILSTFSQIFKWRSFFIFCEFCFIKLVEIILFLFWHCYYMYYSRIQHS